ncbi:ABC transporter ATP-binding protein [Paenibacillus sp. MMS20-IR301]|uniref:ABC transporter ATP-binding protein n=1 Tax=Paenibacillus sp. MMS20-IR301 TaxID=2895946 RepID=UPI0028E4DBC2|nr:ABC transporter ATP-binding protein [Paenibacillus sp. MMS20-IR301]WNS41179.1 ABC transporter ATP-binding protein [Paenibacillus sp. MMS20-IR301]
MLSLKQVSKIYEGKIAYRALSNISLSVEKGEFVGIMGPSGSGKTTLLNIIATIDTPTTGEIVINGRILTELTKDEMAVFRRKELGFVFQDFNLMHSLTVEENIVLPLTLDGQEINYIRRRKEEIAERLELTGILKKRIYEISGGQAQRTAIARAMINDPKLLLADEPTGNLDSKSARNVMELLRELNRSKGTTMVLVTHDAFSASFCNRVIFIKDGLFYAEIHCGEQRQSFFQKITDTLALLGGYNSEFPSIRVP